MDEGPLISIFLVCLVLSGFYSGSEAALMSIGPDRAKRLMEEGGRRAKALHFLVRRPNIVLTTILIGNNLVNILAASIVTVVSQKYFGRDAVAMATGITTFLILIFGEITPKTFARAHAEKLCYYIIRILQFNYYILLPIVLPVTFMIEKILGANAHVKGKLVSQSDIEYLISKAEKDKAIDSKQIDMLSSILEFPSIKVKDIMVGRKEVKYVTTNHDFNQIIHVVRKHGHSRYPVVGTDLDDVIGFLHVKDLSFVQRKETKDFKIIKYLKPAFFVYEHMRIHAVFEYMKKKKVHLALVKDENGIVVGIITLEDIIEEILGEIRDEHDDDQVIDDTPLEEGIVVDGQEGLRTLYHEYGIRIPLNNNYSTIAGFLLDKLGNNFPSEGQMIFWSKYSFQIEKVENQEIAKVRIQQVNGDYIARQ